MSHCPCIPGSDSMDKRSAGSHGTLVNLGSACETARCVSHALLREHSRKACPANNAQPCIQCNGPAAEAQRMEVLKQATVTMQTIWGCDPNQYSRLGNILPRLPPVEAVAAAGPAAGGRATQRVITCGYRSGSPR